MFQYLLTCVFEITVDYYNRGFFRSSMHSTLITLYDILYCGSKHIIYFRPVNYVFILEWTRLFYGVVLRDRLIVLT